MEVYKIALFVLLALFSYAASQQDGDVRLQGGKNTWRGRVEVFDDGNWTSICYVESRLTNELGTVVCRQLGFVGVLEVGNTTTFNLTNGTTPERLGGGDCLYSVSGGLNNAPQHIYRCFFLGVGGCNHGDDLAVACSTVPLEDDPYDTMVDFVRDDINIGTVSKSEGFPRVYVNKAWGPVCNMKKGDADIFCRQLSFTNAVSVEERSVELQDPALVSQFHCKTNANSSVCLRGCYKYPSANQEVSCSSYSYVTCEFVRGKSQLEFYGTQDSCAATLGSHSGAIAGAVMGVLLAITAIAIATGLLYYFLFYRGRTGSFSPSSRTKYDAI